MFEKVLIANRGEIANRIMNTCMEMGIKTVAIYTKEDSNSFHRNKADEAYKVSSYLNIDDIVSVAKENKVDAIHPGYGFLAENPDFAKRCENEGITFIGPKADVMLKLGNKTEAKAIAEKINVPVIPWYHSEDIGKIIHKGKEIGFPILIKASAGGGGRGMRIVYDEKEFLSNCESACREAGLAFGDDSIFIEKYLKNARHIEFQILGDEFGNVINLNERECSIQRRHQKIIEESPSCALNSMLREEMGRAAVKIAEEVGYTNAGTVEFLFSNKRYYFMEVNTRLQVEHTITEETTGIDLVKWQFKIANGEKMRMKQEDIKQIGHAIECRIYAEIPEKNFAPSPGHIYHFEVINAPNIRHEIGDKAEVSAHYDPLIAKVITHAETREENIKKMLFALSNYKIIGVKTNISFLRNILMHKAFLNGDTTTDFIENYFNELVKKEDKKNEALIALALSEMLVKETPKKLYTADDTYSPWKNVKKWRLYGGTL
ncbi:MAG: biotin carboxylase N-terminal domain-containing protein [Candidatus Thermoplasmatota archaeon]